MGARSRQVRAFFNGLLRGRPVAYTTERTRPPRNHREHDLMNRYGDLQRAHTRQICLALLAFESLSILEPAHAQDGDRVTIDAQRCIEIAEPAERLACFEAQVDAARENDAGRAPGAAASPQAQPQPVRTIEIPAQPGQSGRDAEPTEWVGSIASLTERQPGRYLITLTSGEVWVQKVAERYSLRVGQRVRIYNTRWGSAQRLEADGVNGFIQVERVR